MTPSNTTPHDAASDKINVRAWFDAYLAWMIGLAAVTFFGLYKVEQGGGELILAVSLFAAYTFYMSICNTFFFLPTTGVVLFAASGTAAHCVGLAGHPAWQLVIVATIGAIGTGIANLNEYHIFLCLLRWRRAAAIQETRLFRLVSDWFRSGPFWLLTLFNFIPIPVDFVRWLAISSRYPRRWFFFSSFIGRWLRYAVLAATSMGFSLKPWHIAVIQIVLVTAALIRILPRLIRRLRRHDPNTDEPSVEIADAGAATPPDRPEERAAVSATKPVLVAEGSNGT
jgi:membrane protein YqaA with SNARE-associated domain